LSIATNIYTGKVFSIDDGDKATTLTQTNSEYIAVNSAYTRGL